MHFTIGKMFGGLALGALIGVSVPPAAAKTAKECGAEYTANKAAITGVGQKRAAFIKSCRAGTETIPGGSASVTPTAPTIAPTTPVAPAPAAKTSRHDQVTAVTASEAEAQAKCPGQAVVWVNTKSGVYHFKGTHNYGTTKSGTYMCESAATAAGDRAAKNEKHP